MAKGDLNDQITDALTNLAEEVAKNYTEFK